MIRRTHPLSPEAAPSLAQRLARFAAKLRPLYAHPPGAYDYDGQSDLEVVVQLLNLPEWAEWLRAHGDARQAEFATEVLELHETALDHKQLLSDIDDSLQVPVGTTYADAVDQAAQLGRGVRAVLVEIGALDEKDTETDVPALLRALLS